MKGPPYERVYKSQEYPAALDTIEYRSSFGSYGLTVDDTVSAVISDGKLRLRAREQNTRYYVEHPPV